MNKREVSLFLKYPGSKSALQRLQHSYLECVVEHKSGTLEELQSYPPNCLKSDYQLKGTVGTEDDNLVITFVPKQMGIHTVRIFADTREHCKPLAFSVNQNLEVESLPADNMLKASLTFVHQVSPTPYPSFLQNLPKQRTMQAVNPHQSMNSSSTIKDDLMTTMAGVHQMGTEFQSHQQQQQQKTQQNQQQQQQQQQQQKQQACPHFNGNFSQSFTSNLSLSQQYQDFPSSPMAEPTPGIVQQPRFSCIPSLVGSHPMSSMIEDPRFSGINSMAPYMSTFSELHSKKKVGEPLSNIRKNFFSMDYNQQVTRETFNNIRNDIKQLVGHKDLKTKRRCDVCSKKTKVSKIMVIGEHDFCETCFKRQYILRTAIDHFMVPTVQECLVDVPINKKATRHITTRMTITDINLRGLEPNEVRFAQEEIKRFDMDDSGWIVKALVFPLLRACLSACLNDQEIRHLLTSQSLKSLMTSYGLDDRVEVHELEFLGLLAFMAREAVSLHRMTSAKAGKKFSPNDLAMAYSFHNQFGYNGHQCQPPIQRQTNISSSHPSNVGLYHKHDHHLLNVLHYQLDAAPKHHSITRGHPVQLQHNSLAGEMDGVITGQKGMSVGHGRSEWMFQREQDKIYPSQCPPGQNLDIKGQGIMSGNLRQPGHDNILKQSMELTVSPLQFWNPHRESGLGAQEREKKGLGLYTAVPHSEIHNSMHSFEGNRHQFHPLEGERGGMMDVSRSSDHDQLIPKVPLLGGGSDVLQCYFPEEDREELPVKLPTILPEKDPSRQTITVNKKNTSSKKFMHDLKLTGDMADSWMLY